MQEYHGFDGVHKPHCLFMNWGLPTEASCLCDPQATANLQAVWGPIVMNVITSTPSEVYQLSGEPGLTDHKQIEYTYVSDSYEPAQPSFPLVHPIPIRAFKPPFLSVDIPLPQSNPTPEPEYPCQTPTSSSGEPYTPSSRSHSPVSSSCASQSTFAGPTSQITRAKRSRDAYEDEDGDAYEDDEYRDEASDITSSSKLTTRPARRRRTINKGSPDYLTTSFSPEPSTPTRRSMGLSDRRTSSLDDFIFSPVPFDLNGSADEYEREIDLFFNPPSVSPIYAPSPPPPTSHAPDALSLYQCTCTSFLAASTFQAGWSNHEGPESCESSLCQSQT